MNGRVAHVIEGLIFSLAVVAVFFVLALLAKWILKKSIGTPKYYSFAVFSGWLIYAGLISVLPKLDTPEWSRSSNANPIAVDVIGLDARFIAPPKDKLESFPAQLQSAMETLSPADKIELNDAIGFLTYAEGERIKETDPERFAKWKTASDVAAHSLNKLYNFAVSNGENMTLRQYILVADEWKKKKPDLFKQYTASNKEP
jgi:hypothetical protein